MTSMKDVTVGFGDRSTWGGQCYMKDDEREPMPMDQWLDDDRFNALLKADPVNFEECCWDRLREHTMAIVLMTITHRYMPIALQQFWTGVSVSTDIIEDLLTGEICADGVIDLALSGDYQNIPAELAAVYGHFRSTVMDACQRWQFVITVWEKQA